MKRRCLLLCLLLGTLLLGAGCGSEWDEFWKDLRGDNQKMRSDFGRAGDDQSELKP
jgi:hypothetical protein